MNNENESADLTNPYRDLLELEHPTSGTHPRMSLLDRAAQFSPFAALTGHSEILREEARYTDSEVELTESELSLLDEKLSLLAECIQDRPKVTIRYFKRDPLKEGGSYETVSGILKKIDTYSQKVVFETGEAVGFRTIVDIESLF